MLEDLSIKRAQPCQLAQKVPLPVSMEVFLFIGMKKIVIKFLENHDQINSPLFLPHSELVAFGRNSKRIA